jgi:hypothetical protein
MANKLRTGYINHQCQYKPETQFQLLSIETQWSRHHPEKKRRGL